MSVVFASIINKTQIDLYDTSYWIRYKCDKIIIQKL